MKRNPLKKFIPFRLALIIAPLLAAWPKMSPAATIYWDNSGGTANDWASVANWSTVVGGGTNPAAIPGTGDVAQFSATSVTAAQTANLNADRSVQGLLFSTTLAHTLAGGGTNRTLTLGTSGMVKSNTGAVTIGSTTGGQQVAVALGADQSWDNNNNTGAISVLNGVSSNAAGARILSLGGSSTAANTVSGVIGNGSGQVSVNKTGAGTWVLSGANTFTGGTTLTGGILQLNNATGAGPAGSTVTYPAASTGRLFLNGGVTASYNLDITAGTTGAVGQGLVQQTGTGQATINGNINLGGQPSSGGVFVGGAATGNELVIGAPINGGAVGMSQRDGRVIYRGGGTISGNFVATGTALVGAANGLPTNLIPNLGGSGSATLDLNGFDQAAGGLVLGNTGAANAFTGNVLIGAKTLTLNGNISTISAATVTATHNITSTTGALDVGAAGATVSVTDSLAVDDLVISGNVTGAGGLTKTGAGSLALNGANVFGPVNVNGGILSAGRAPAYGSFSSLALNFGAGSTLFTKISTAQSDVISTGTLTAAGGVNVLPFQPDGAVPAGTYPLISYTGASPGTGGFNLVPTGHLNASLTDTGSAIALLVTGNDRVIWDGTNSSSWATGATGNFKLQSNATAADFVSGDDVIFADSPTLSSVDVALPVLPSRVSFTNNAATTYTVAGAGGIFGPTAVSKSGDGRAILRTQNGYIGATTVTAGTLELDHDATGNAVLTGTSGVSIGAAGTVDLTRDDGPFTFTRNLTGTGTVQINAHSAAGSTSAHTVALTGTNTGFTGTLRLLAPASGTYRVSQPPPANLGGGSIEVQSGAQVYTAATQTYNNAISITGSGFADTNGFIGALRLENGANWAGPVSLNGVARIGCHNGTATVSGAISGGDLEANVTNYNNNYTLILTGTNTYGTTVIGGQNTQTAGVPSMRLNIGANGTTGTLGTGNVTINGDGANGVLGFDRSNGYTLLPGQTITAAGSNLLRTFVDLDCQGSGFNDNGNTINMGGSSFITGGQVRAGQSRANTVATISGNLTAGRLGNAVANNSTININNGAVVNVGYFTTGEAANNGGTVNQASGTTVNVTEQLRLGHFGTETSVYNMNGGSLTLTGASPTLTPSTAGAGTAGSTGDNNINATNPATIVGGGIYLGIDGTGIFNQNAGTVTTNWIVLDNRGDTGAGANMPDGIDRYNLNGGTLNLRSSYGLIGRNVSTAVSFAGGTVRVDNTGTGTGTGANITVPLDAVITTSGAGTTLDTNGSGNGFTLTKNIFGTAPIGLTGGGTVNLNPAANQLVQPPLVSAGAAMLTKLGLNTTTLIGSGAGFAGGITVGGGRLDVPSDATPSSLSVAGGAAMSGEPAVSGTTSLNSATLLFDPNTPGALTTGVLDVTGTNLLDLTTIPTGAGPWTAINYTSKTGAGSFAVANPASYRVAPAIADTGTAITLDVQQGKTLAWTGATGGVWDINTSSNWLDTAPPNGAEKFFNADIVAFADGALNPSITITGSVIPLAVIVNNSATAYSFTSTAGNQLSGPGGITKSGTGALTLTGPNIHAGPTDITGGTVNIAAGTSLGNGALTNKVNLSGGGRLNVTAATDLGLTRGLTTGTGGGTLAVTNTAATTVTVPGNLSGSALLTVTSGSTGAATVVLSGDNTGSTGGITVNSDGGGATTLRLGSATAAPGGGTLTLANPTSGASGAATGLDLAGNTVPATVLVSTSSLLSGANSYRTQVVSGVSGGAINGPIEVNGTSIVQFNSNNTNGITLNGAISAGPGGFNATTSTFFIRGTGTGTINGTINLPGAIVAKTDAATWTINSSTGNNWLLTSVLSTGSLKIGANNALPVGSNLNIGQGSDGAASLFDLNGFNQEVATIIYTPGNASSTRGITNTSAIPSTLTVNNATDISYGASTGVTGGTLQGNLSLVKAGAGNLTLAGAGSFTGSVLVSSGILTAGGTQNTTALGSPNTAGRTITVSAGAELRMSTNNVFGNGQGNANLPALSASGLISSTRYNTIGAVTLNGGTLTQSATDSGGYEGYQFKGAISVVGTAPSTISSGNGKANHLDTNTVFNVADVTGNSTPDLVVSTVLRNQSNDFAAAAGGLTKTGAGTLQLAAGVTHTYTGATAVAGGTLQVDGTVGSSAVAVGGSGTLSGNGTISAATTVASGGTVAPGASVGTLNFGATVAFASGSTYAVEITGAAAADKVVAAGAITADGTVKVTLSGYTPVANDTFDVADAASITGTPTFDFTDAALTAGLTWDTSQFLSSGILKVVSASADPFDAWATANGVTGGKGGDDDGDGANNLLEFATNSDPKTNGSGARAYGKLHSISGDNVLTLTVAVRKSALFAAQGSKQSATKDSVVYTVEASDDLLTWNTVLVTELNAADSAAVQAALGLPTLDADWEWHSFRTDGGTTLDPRDMIRLSVSAEVLAAQP